MIQAVCTPNTLQGLRRGISLFPEVTNKIIGWVSKYFGLVENGFFLSYGAKEVLVDGILAKRKIEPLRPDATWVEKATHKIRTLSAKVFQVHGELYVASAIAGTAVELDQLGFITLGTLAPAISLVGSGLFLYASLLSLAYHVDLYQNANEIEENGGGKPLTHSIKASAVMGIINSLGYAIAAIATIAGAGVSITLLFGFIALGIGCIKVLYDYFVLSKALMDKNL